MTRLKQGLYVAATLAMLSIAVFFFFAGITMLHIDEVAVASKSLVVETQSRVVDTSQNVNALLIQLGLAADNVRRASEQEKAVSTKTLAILDHTDTLLAATKVNEDQITLHTVQAVDGIPPLLAELKTTSQSANALIADPHIKETLDNAAESSAEAVSAMKNVSDTTADLKKKADDMLKPAALSVRVATWSLRVLAGVRDIFTIF